VAQSYLPPDLELVGMRGVRIVTPTSQVFRVPVLATMFETLERTLCDLPLVRSLGGFLILVARKKHR
jgi:hypothetical protein